MRSTQSSSSRKADLFRETKSGRPSDPASDSEPPQSTPPDAPEPGTVVQTACGATVHWSPALPQARYGDRTIYFCLPACKEDFDLDPHRSCLVIWLANQKP